MNDINSTADHARLSPSASDRWISCPASVLEIEALPRIEPETSIYAEEGTICHELAEIRGRAHFGQITKAQAKKEVTAWRKRNGVDLHTENEMWGHVDTWLRILSQLIEEHYHAPTIHFEQRLNTGVPSSWGTTDCAIVSSERIDVVDFKYGAGVQVDAENNSQLRLYGLGVLDEYDIVGTVKKVNLVIVQPRIGEGHLSMELMDADDLRAWRKAIIPIAESALLPGAPYGPSDKACRWCPLSGNCRAQMERIFEEEVDFEADPRDLTPEEVSEILAVLPQIKTWVASFEAVALHRALDRGERIPGWKVVMSGGKRSCKDEESVLATLKAEGHKLDDVTTRKLVGIGVLEGLLGKKGFTDLLGQFYPKSPGKPSLVPEDDNRPALDREAEAASIFGKEPTSDDIL